MNTGIQWTDRTMDVIKHLGSYTRLCKGCHVLYDSGSLGAYAPPSLLEVALQRVAAPAPVAPNAYTAHR